MTKIQKINFIRRYNPYNPLNEMKKWSAWDVDQMYKNIKKQLDEMNKNKEAA